jgi:predicted transcriptional regulator
VLPNSAVEVGPAAGAQEVVRGQLISVDDTATTVLRSDGEVVFIPNEQVRSKTLCPEPVRPPDSVVSVRGWPVEESALSWIAPTHRDSEVDPRCLGRTLNPR